MYAPEFKNRVNNDLNDMGKTHEENDNSVNVERMSEQDVNYFYLLMQSIQNLRFAIATEEDGGVRVCLSVLSMLPEDVRNSFTKEIKTIRDIISSPEYNNTIKVNPYTKQRTIVTVCTLVVNQYRLYVSEILGKFIDVIRKKGWLFKTKSELMGGE